MVAHSSQIPIPLSHFVFSVSLQLNKARLSNMESEWKHHLGSKSFLLILLQNIDRLTKW